ncbi:MAG: hypothetical protein ACO35Q_10575 [Prochlorothrix sp.]
MDLLALLIIAVVVGLLWVNRQSLVPGRSSSRRSTQLDTFGGVRVSPRLWRQLVKLTKDEQTAHRLVRNLLIRHPDRDPSWCCDKAIYDLERDRYRR